MNRILFLVIFLSLLIIIFLVLFVLALTGTIGTKKCQETYKEVEIDEIPNPKCTGAIAGFGDRIGDYLLISTIARLKGMGIIQTTWDTASYNRGNEYPSNIEDYVQFPYNLKIYNIIRNLSECKDLIGVDDWPLLKDWYYGINYNLKCAHKMLMTNNIIDSSYQEFEKSYYTSADEFKYKLSLDVPLEFYAVHIRKGDKMKGTDGMTRNIDAEKEESILTKAIEDQIRQYKGYWIVLSDSPETKVKFEELIESLGGSVYKVPKVPEGSAKGLEVVQDFFILTKSSKIISSSPGLGKYSGFSSFSYVPSVMRKIPFITASRRKSRFDFLEEYSGKTLHNVVYSHEEIEK